MSKLTYIRCGDYDIPNLKLSEQPETSIGKYGRMRKSYLKEHRPILYNHLLMSEKLYPHLLEIERTAQGRVDAMLPHMMETAGVTEELKACDPMRWVGLMNTLHGADDRHHHPPADRHCGEGLANLPEAGSCGGAGQRHILHEQHRTFNRPVLYRG